MRSSRTLALAVMLLVATAACGGAADANPSAQHAHPNAITTSAPSIALVQTTPGIAAVAATTDTVVWSARNAVAAPDGSAVFSTDDTGLLTELDPHTGATIHSWPVPRGVAPVVVSPAGIVVALSDRPTGYDSEAQPRLTTHLVVLGGLSGAISRDLMLSGDVEPEAFSLDHNSLFVLYHRGDHYRVQSLDLASGERSDLIDRDKNPSEDMRGRAVHGVLSSDRQQLATLYINPDNPMEPAFVHVLNLNGWSYCVDLPDEFAQGPARSQSIERTADDHAIVRAPAIGRRAEFSLADVSDGQTVKAATQPSTQAAVDAPYRAVDGFVALIAVIPPRV